MESLGAGQADSLLRIRMISSQQPRQRLLRPRRDQRGGGSYTYKVCQEGSSACSNEATVTF